MSIRIVVDSTADLSRECRERVTAVPLTVHFGEKEYLDGVSITPEHFYRKLVASQELPSTMEDSALEWVKTGCLWWPKCPDNESIHSRAAGV